MVATKAKLIRTEDLSQVAEFSNPNDDNALVRRTIEQLPARDKELIVLRYYNGLSYEQIGSVLGISKATINGRLTRAKRKMKKYLQRNGFSENQ